MSYAHRKPGSPIHSGETFTPHTDIPVPEKKVGAHPAKPGGYDGTYPVPLEEAEDLATHRTEVEEAKERVEAYEEIILSVQKKFEDIDHVSAEQKKGFFVRFDPKLYPRVSSAVAFYTDAQEDDYIDEKTYAKAKADLEQAATVELDRVRQSIRTGADVDGNIQADTPYGGATSLQQQADDIRGFNVSLMAFKQLLGYFADWLFSLGVIKAAMRFFGYGKYRNASGARRETLNEMLRKMRIPGFMVQGRDGRWEDRLARKDLDITIPGDTEHIVSHAEILMSYVIGVIQGDEVAIEAHIPNPTPFLLDRILLPMKKEFVNVTALTETFIDTTAIRDISRGSSAYIPESVPYNRQAIVLTRNIRPLLQEEFLQRLDGNLARILRILQGWYLDPRTYCCLVNALGGIGSLVPKWLHALRFGLWFGVAQIDLELSGLTRKITNLLNLIVQGILGVIVMHLHSFASGWLSAKEHELMGSILNSSSKFVQCAPFDVLVSEYTQYFRGLLSQLRAHVSDFTGKLMISMDHYDLTVSLLEKRQRTAKLLGILDLFIDAWQMGYICTDRGVVSTAADSDILRDEPGDGGVEDVGAGDGDAAGATDVFEVAQDEDTWEEGRTGQLRPLVSKEEMVTFLSTKLDLPNAFVDDVGALYDDPTALQGCLAGFSQTRLSIYREQISRILQS